MLDTNFLNIPDLISTHAASFADKPAIIMDSTVVTWREFDQHTNRLANALRAAGLRAGDRVAALAPNGYQLIELIFATHKAGGCFVPVSAFLSGDQMGLLLRDAAATFFFAGRDYLDRVEELRATLPSVQPDRWVAFDFEAPAWRTLDDLLSGSEDHRPERWHQLPDMACLWYSSGTTGTPKGIIRSHQSLQALGILCGLDMNIDSRAIALLGTPLSASGTWINLMSAIIAGGTVVSPPRCSAPDIIALVERHRVTHTMLVPTQLNMILEEPSLAGADLSSIRGLLTLGSKLHGYTKSQTLARITPNLFELYGLTEGFGTLAKPSEHSTKPGSVGRPILGCEIRIIDEEGRELPAGEVGEIVGLGPFTMGGYFNRPDETRSLLWRDASGRIFLKSGDIGRRDEEGFIYIMDRRKDMIITGGLNIYPADIEAVIGEHQDVVELVVVGAPHRKWGETPVGLVKLRAGSAVTEHELLEWANARLGKHQRLSDIVFWDEFPRNALGKLVKPKIRETFLKSFEASESLKQ
ncbi:MULTISPECIES: AMP-binding protein [unclassified Chelatococcus]|uniref:class I adenylate-forming enzyme family protein n=1 Tax=unclassified Chelatococcus TaxID=2638111 RepID=UPI001BD04502|nr:MULTISPECIES: AMP-binding protein [unclassified Chelatococcus]MBS7700633.1 AMP-binding protein [Chelatococcus sp. YT9]MBX3559064.1 AMP-binding protein [Chelatococcus sp.]